MNKSLPYLKNLAQQIQGEYPMISEERALELAIQIDRTETLEGWIEKISQALHRIDEGIDRLKED